MQTESEKLNSRARGLEAAYSGRWPAALMWLTQAARKAIHAQEIIDNQVLDALAEAAYRMDTPEALSPFQNHYKYPPLAAHMARAFLMLGDTKSAEEFLSYASESPLKAGVQAMLDLDPGEPLHHREFFDVAKNYPQLVYAEYWRALAAVADSHDEADLVHRAEQRSQALAYRDPNVHFNQALRLLSKKEFVAGWRVYEARLIPGAKSHNRTQFGHNIPMWEGQNIRGKRLAIFYEQGLGDMILGLRFIQPLRDMGIEIVLVVRAMLIELAKASFPDLKILDEEKVQREEFWRERPRGLADFWVYSLSIPAKAGLFAPVNTGAYLKATPQAIENPRGLPVFSVNWHGRIDTKFDRSRAFSVASFLEVTPVLDKPSLVISVQKDATAEEISELSARVREAGGEFIDAGPQLTDFAQTAAWISASDHLWTCDTSVAHLGGALGHPTTVMVRNKKIWQWVLRDESLDQSVWYDSVRIRYALLNEKLGLFT